MTDSPVYTLKHSPYKKSTSKGFHSEMVPMAEDDSELIPLRKIDSDALWVLSKLSQAGYQARLVGGGVRDLLLGKAPKDFDVATNATPNQVRRVIRNSRIIGRRFKLVHCYFGRGKTVEVATFRRVEEDSSSGEQESSGPILNDNTFGDERSDAFRRDLTINGLFFDPETGQVVDHVGGLADLKAGIIRVIGDPRVRISEDPVRMLRVIRHACRAGFRVEDATWKGVTSSIDLILDCSQARVYDEFCKDLGSGVVLDILLMLYQSGLLNLLLPVCRADMLVESHGFFRSMKSWDERVRAGESFPVTIFFALLVLFSRSPYPQNFSSPAFLELDQICDVLEVGFKHLRVVRRIKDQLESLLSLWVKLEHGDLNQISRSEARHAPLALLLHRILPSGSNDRVIFRRLKETARRYKVDLIAMDDADFSRPPRRRRANRSKNGNSKNDNNGSPS